MSKQEVRITNPPIGLGGLIVWVAAVLLIINSCTDDCRGKGYFECAGVTYKQVETEFKKGYGK